MNFIVNKNINYIYLLNIFSNILTMLRLILILIKNDGQYVHILI